MNRNLQMLDDQTEKDTLLEVNNIEVIYNHVILVLKGVSLTVSKGGITALLGGNGAGKTTTINMLAGNILTSSSVLIIFPLSGLKLSISSISFPTQQT